MSARPVFLLLFFWLGGTAAAQPMMPDPSQMSGIPRPDPQVPAGTVTVRLIRGELQNRLPGVDVELVNLADDKDTHTEKTNEEGRATFTGLGTGKTYEARATVDAEALASQPIELLENPGVRVMLVFSKSIAEQQKEIGTPDGKARVDQGLEKGLLLVKVVGEGNKPLKDATVVVSHASRSSQKVDELPSQATSEEGVARFTAVPSGPDDGYMVSVAWKGTPYRSKPFRMVENHGSQLSMQVLEASHETDKLTIANGSHLILEMQDEVIQVLENLRLHNPLEQPLDPGPRGLRIPLPEGALSPQMIPGSAAALSVDVSQAGQPPQVLWKGPIPPGDSDVRVGFGLKHEGALSFRQPVSVRFEALRIIVEKTPELKFEGQGFDSESRRFNGRDLILLSGPPPGVGGTIEFSLTGLPYQTPLVRYFAAGLALFIVIGFGVLTYRGPMHVLSASDQAQKRRQRLEGRRQSLMEQVLHLDRKEAGARDAPSGKKKPADRKQLLSELEQVYRELDGLS